MRWKEEKKTFPSDVDFPDDAVSAPAIKEGHLLSGGKEDERDSVNYTNAEMRQFSSDKTFDWRDGSKYHHVHKVKAGDKFDIHWDYTMAHKTRGYSYEITDHPTTDHSIILPEREAGFHVLLERWIVADTGMAFHQSWVLEYEASLGGEGQGDHGGHC
ncbi:lytic polysaccharide monooxygenase auxiliary activity family 9 protein [Rickettsia hoogstraalii]|uniref:lytic polysaccharide monooxygenase n=1 Tax=Rickettsia hoogstraalii TaxID=467174 RepID=UPI000B0F1F55|nr:lytic polysaccharide monooxygenase [Rickettsia hoogstraalii]